MNAIDALRQQKAWVQHWMDDRAANLKPTEDSLNIALAQIDAALAVPPSQQFSDALSTLPSLAKAAGCFVEVRVTEGTKP
jgi:hypothetical protein